MDLPDILPVMPLGRTVFFPHAVIPLYIYEPRYREMLETALASHRMFILTPDSRPLPSCKVATVGLIRISRLSTNGTSRLLLQGLARIRMTEYLEQKPFLQARIQAFHTPPCDHQDSLPLHHQILTLIEHYLSKQPEPGPQILPILKRMSSPDAFLDLAGYLLCKDSNIQQRLLESPNLLIRYQLMIHWLNQQIREQKNQPRIRKQ